MFSPGKKQKSESNKTIAKNPKITKRRALTGTEFSNFFDCSKFLYKHLNFYFNLKFLKVSDMVSLLHCKNDQVMRF